MGNLKEVRLERAQELREEAERLLAEAEELSQAASRPLTAEERRAQEMKDLGFYIEHDELSVGGTQVEYLCHADGTRLFLRPDDEDMEQVSTIVGQGLQVASTLSALEELSAWS